MDYSRLIDLDNVEIEDCLELYYKKDIITIINDGHIVNFEKTNERK